MTYQRHGRTGIAVLLVLFLLTGFGAGFRFSAFAEGPVNQPRVQADPVPPWPVEEILPNGELPGNVITVSNVDELLAALGPDRVIRLADGEYNLISASSYGRTSGSAFWTWEDSYDGYQLCIQDVSGLSLVGNGNTLCSILAEPRYANVLHFNRCENINIVNLTAGHSPGEGYCSGGVLDFRNCGNVQVLGCDLFGCGTYGITADNCVGLTARGTVIRECSYGAMEALSCLDVRFADGAILRCGLSREFGDDWVAFDLLHADMCTGFAVLNTQISWNRAQTLISSTGSVGFLLGGCRIHDNTVGQHETYTDDRSMLQEWNWGAMFRVSGQAVTVSGTSFANNTLLVPFFDNSIPNAAQNPVADQNGVSLGQEALEAMEFEPYSYESYEAPASGSNLPVLNGSVTEAGLMEYHVTTADEFLAAIGNNTIIHVDVDLLDFNTASTYGGFGGAYYHWLDIYDGPGLVISGVSNLYIVGSGKDQTVLQATPRYAEVLYFENCNEVHISDLTAGHLKEAPGSCAGDVFEFSACMDVSIENCGLFGCGVSAVNARDCSDFAIRDTEMYECSENAVYLWNSNHFSFENCSIHDCGQNGLNLSQTHHITWDGNKLTDGYFEP